MWTIWCYDRFSLTFAVCYIAAHKNDQHSGVSSASAKDLCSFCIRHQSDGHCKGHRIASDKAQLDLIALHIEEVINCAKQERSSKKNVDHTDNNRDAVLRDVCE